jgi:hypothetical protein
LVVLESPAAQGSSAKEQQQEDHGVNNEDKDNEEHSPMSDIDIERMY